MLVVGGAIPQGLETAQPFLNIVVLSIEWNIVDRVGNRLEWGKTSTGEGVSRWRKFRQSFAGTKQGIASVSEATIDIP